MTSHSTPRGSCLAAACGLIALLICLVASASASADDPVLAAAGDIACAPGSTVDASDCHQAQTASLLTAASPAPAVVAALGDEQYNSGTFAEFTGVGAFDQTWGQVKPLIRPAPGNHEYDVSPSAAGYFQYFGSAAGPASGYYSYNLGAWHVVSLNSNCSDSGCQDAVQGAVPSAEVSWLQSDLAAHQGMCTLAYWHHPLFSSGAEGPSPAVGPLWQALYQDHADVVLNGHDHDYERFAPQDPTGAGTPAGIRELVVGTGGMSHFAMTTSAANSQFEDSSDFGVLFLTLHPGSYDWRFVGEQGQAIDQGSTACHWQPPQVTTGAASQITSTGAQVAGSVNPNGQTTTWRFQYGLSKGYGRSSPTFTLPAGSTAVPATAAIGGLNPDSIYHYRLIASNPAGTTYGPDQALTTSPATPYGATILATPGLWHYWRLGELSGTGAYDTDGVANGTYGGGVALGQASLVVGSQNAAAAFDGTGYVSTPSLGTAGDLTIEAWAQLSSAATTSTYGNNTIYGAYGHARLLVRPSYAYGGVWIGGAEYAVSAYTASNVATRVHWALVRSGTTLTLYRDGVALATRSVPTGSVAVAGTIGAEQGNEYFLHGLVDEVAVYRAALSQATLQQHFAAGG